MKTPTAAGIGASDPATPSVRTTERTAPPTAQHLVAAPMANPPAPVSIPTAPSHVASSSPGDILRRLGIPVVTPDPQRVLRDQVQQLQVQAQSGNGAAIDRLVDLLKSNSHNSTVGDQILSAISTLAEASNDGAVLALLKIKNEVEIPYNFEAEERLRRLADAGNGLAQSILESEAKDITESEEAVVTFQPFRPSAEEPISSGHNYGATDLSGFCEPLPSPPAMMSPPAPHHPRRYAAILNPPLTFLPEQQTPSHLFPGAPIRPTPTRPPSLFVQELSLPNPAPINWQNLIGQSHRDMEGGIPPAEKIHILLNEAKSDRDVHGPLHGLLEQLSHHPAPEMRSLGLKNLGRFFEEISKNPELALDFYMQAIHTANCDCVAEIANLATRIPPAMTCLQQLQGHPNPEFKAKALYNLALIEEKRGNIPRAIEMYGKHGQKLAIQRLGTIAIGKPEFAPFAVHTLNELKIRGNKDAEAMLIKLAQEDGLEDAILVLTA